MIQYVHIILYPESMQRHTVSVKWQKMKKIPFVLFDEMSKRKSQKRQNQAEKLQARTISTERSRKGGFFAPFFEKAKPVWEKNPSCHQKKTEKYIRFS